ncbi:LamG domain-containing protein [Streptomyces sp. HNM0574]|uniref:LamG domain-containing protein n=1 Tax=Streptomyces sp. HNM0574 TaxID=2714954 RepID=UPI00146B768E|nr:LamG domain-containing protein [Streptomyces sp. HNM0574]NLU66434.1 LamG domain-containing protein [Streptomyces sp. HNM0574]
MTRRWSLIALIAALAVALAFVVVQIVTGEKPEEKKAAEEKTSASGSGGDEAKDLEGDGWWPLHQSGTGRAEGPDAVTKGGTKWADGPNGGALQLNGTDGSAEISSPVLDTAKKDYSVAARVRLTAENMNGFRTAVSVDGEKASTFYLQYSGADKRFAFSFIGARTLDQKTGEPEKDRWYHLVGTYSQDEKQMKIYVDGELAGTRKATNPVEPTGGLAIGRGKNGGKPADHWKGDISDVHVYQRELTQDEVSSLSASEPG